MILQFFNRFKLKKFLVSMSIISVLVLLDLFIKKQVFQFLFNRNSVIYNVFSGFDLVIVLNRGISFGLFQNYGFSNILFIFISIGISIGLFLYAIIKTEGIAFYALITIVGGALGNIYDRFYIGAVRDFLDFSFAGYHWPAFNLADSFICVGGFFYFISLFYTKK